MIEAEILFPVTCPVCEQQALTGFRMTVVIDAVLSGQIRLYSSCHLAAWDASERELDALLEYLDTAGADSTGETCREFEIEESAEHKTPMFVHTGVHDRLRSHDAL
jgi:hypothetical protein